MKYSKFGEFARILRIQNHQVMGNMAEILNVSVPFLSAVETGKKNVPAKWLPILVNYYQLSDTEAKDLAEAIRLSRTQVKLNLVNSSDLQRRVAMKLEEEFSSINDEKMQRIYDILKGDE